MREKGVMRSSGWGGRRKGRGQRQVCKKRRKGKTGEPKEDKSVIKKKATCAGTAGADREVVFNFGAKKGRTTKGAFPERKGGGAKQHAPLGVE